MTNTIETAAHLALLAPVPLEHRLDGQTWLRPLAGWLLEVEPGRSFVSLIRCEKVCQWTRTSMHHTLVDIGSSASLGEPGTCTTSKV